jgi:hypothetical protein
MPIAPLPDDPDAIADPDRGAAVDAGLRFGVRTGLAAHRPPGNVDRVRTAPSRNAAEVRRRFDGGPIHEPARRKA